MNAPQLMISPSLLMRSGLKILQQDDMILLKFTEELSTRWQELRVKHTTQSLTTEESAELAGIQETERILTLLNSKLAVQNQWSPSKLATLSEIELENDANTATLLSL